MRGAIQPCSADSRKDNVIPQQHPDLCVLDLDRRKFLARARDAFAFLALAEMIPLPTWAQRSGGVEAIGAARAEGAIDLVIDRSSTSFGGKSGHSLAVNGTIPGPLIRLKEGEEAILRVSNKLSEIASIHWHGILLPPEMDGVPGVSFAGIKPGGTFTYKFPVRQSGTYWYHSHSGGQEQQGVYGPIVIEPKEREAVSYDRDYVIFLSDWSSLEPMKLVAKLKKDAGYFNFQKRTVGDFAADIRDVGIGSAFSERLRWLKMRMDPTDILDLTGAAYIYLLNGHPASNSWTGIFKKGERVRLRFIDGAAMSIFDVRIPGLKMTLIEADGQPLTPVDIDEFRIGPGETYDVIVEPTEEKAYAVFAESMDRSGYALGNLAPREGMQAQMPDLRKRPERTMADMGMSMEGMSMNDMPGMLMGGAAMEGMVMPSTSNTHQANTSEMKMRGHEMGDKNMRMQGHDMKSSQASAKSHPGSSHIPGAEPVRHGADSHGPGNSFVPETTRNRMHEPGTGLENSGRKALVYTDLRALHPYEDQRQPEREIEIHLTGNMDRYMWSIDGKKYSEASDPILFRYGERLRLTMVNDTMMEHPMHLHGMWMYPENGTGAYLPRKHTIIVKPAERLSVAITADAKGDWAFHCHMLFHMEMGMFRVVRVSGTGRGQ